MNKPLSVQLPAFVLLVALAAGSRFLGIAPNFAAVAAVALFSGWFFPSRILAAAAPILAMAATDAVIGGYSWKLMLVVYASLLIPTLAGRALGARPGAVRIALASVGASLFFFVITNFAVWAFSADVAYPKTLAGLTACFVNALPFFRFTLAGDVCFSALLFGGYALAARRMPVLFAKPAPAFATAR